MFRITIFLIAVMLLIVGCDENTPSSPEPDNYYIALDNLPETVISPNSVTRQFEFTITVINLKDNLPVSGEELTLTLDGPGDVTPAQATTDSDGFVDAVWSVSPPLGETTATITAEVGGFSSQESIEIEGTVRPFALSLTADPQSFVAPRGSSVSIELSAYVSDANGVGTVTTPIRFSMIPVEGGERFGSLTPDYVTDNNGLAEATFHSQSGFGRMVIRCQVDNQYLNPPVYGEVIVEVIEEAADIGILRLSSNRSHIYADNGISTARITVLMQNEHSAALAGEQIGFSVNNNGIIPNSAVTDNQGIAQVELSDIGLVSMNAQGDREPCRIIARNPRYRTADTIFVDIRPPENVQSILLSTENRFTGINDSVWVRATCFLDPNRSRIAPPGKVVQFVLDPGLGRYSDVQVITDQNGTAETEFIAGAASGIVTLNAQLRNPDDPENLIQSNDVELDIRPGPPDRMSMLADPVVLRIGEGGVQSLITASVRDSAGNPVRDGTMVTFSPTLGTMHPSSVVTADGQATSFLRPGEQSGVSTVTGTVQSPSGEVRNQTWVQFIAGGESSIELTANPLQIEAFGPSGGNGSTLYATVRDIHGNLVQIPTQVVFELITEDEPPMACNINYNDPFNMDTSVTDNGVATARLNPGFRIGYQLLRAFTLDANGQPTGIEDYLRDVQVVSGPPEDIDIDFNLNGRDAGGGAWQIEVSARVHDVWRNPVADNIPVVFSVNEDFASINPGFTGNRGIFSDPTPGVAFAALTYNGRDTFEQITVSAYCRTEQVDSVGGHAGLMLPLQQGELSLNVDPGNWLFERGEGDTCNIRVWAICRDGHNILVDNAPVLFSTSRGRLYPSEEDLGSATVWLRGTEESFFLDDEAVEEVIELNATVEGYDVHADSVNVIMTRR